MAATSRTKLWQHAGVQSEPDARYRAQEPSLARLENQRCAPHLRQCAAPALSHLPLKYGADHMRSKVEIRSYESKAKVKGMQGATWTVYWPNGCTYAATTITLPMSVISDHHLTCAGHVREAVLPPPSLPGHENLDVTYACVFTPCSTSSTPGAAAVATAAATAAAATPGIDAGRRAHG